MNPGANVTSLPALEAWHAALVIFRTDALDALASVSTEINRIEGWLTQQLSHWQRTSRDGEEEVAQAKNELRSRRFPDWSGRMPDTTVQEEHLAEVERKLDFARDQIQVVRRWIINLGAEIGEVYDAPARHLGQFLEGDMPRAIAVLARQMDAIDAYLQLAPESATPARKASP